MKDAILTMAIGIFLGISIMLPEVQSLRNQLSHSEDESYKWYVDYCVVAKVPIWPKTIPQYWVDYTEQTNTGWIEITNNYQLYVDKNSWIEISNIINYFHVKNTNAVMLMPSENNIGANDFFKAEFGTNQ
jgi:hypothetical protein